MFISNPDGFLLTLLSTACRISLTGFPNEHVVRKLLV